MPRRFPEREVEPFVREKSAWIERTLRRFAESELEFPPAVVRDGGSVPYLGERLALRVHEEARRVRPHVKLRDGALQVALPPSVSLRDALERWYRRRARDRGRAAPRRRLRSR